MSTPSISSHRDFDLESRAQALYSPDLAYHNFQHVLDTLEAASDITAKCVEEGIRVDTRVVYYALLFHDAGFRDDHLTLGFATKEAYSADLAERYLTQLDVPAKMIAKVAGAILSTHKDAAFVTVEQKAVRAADLSGLAAEYSIFVENSKNLKQEYELFHQKHLNWPQWVENASATIRFYLAQEIRLTSYFFDDQGESAYHRLVRKNLERLVNEAQRV